ncbi:MAG: archaetidylserine decarboxylase [Gammaproteobacteria bacterium]|nr:archaetidylserine decarboxylase [Gammaproteobacteria bacterium]
MIRHLLERLLVWPQYVLPQHGLSRAVYHLSRWTFSPWKNLLIRMFIRAFRVDMAEAGITDPTGYDCFNSFFTRALKPGARPHEHSPDRVICPVDGYLSEFGTVSDEQMIQAKGKSFTLDGLLAGNAGLVDSFRDGYYATLYLAPRNYHRIHMPSQGRLQQVIYVPGCLFAVNGHTVRHVDRLFSRNERAITVFSTPCGRMALIMVGAIFVGSMETVWAGEINSPYPKAVRTDNYEKLPRAIELEQADEMGRFNMGSTVILLFEKGSITWLDSLVPGQGVRMGETIAKRKMT